MLQFNILKSLFDCYIVFKTTTFQNNHWIVISIFIFLIILSFESLAYNFNKNKLIEHSSKSPILNTDEGFLYLSVSSKDFFSSFIIENVDTGKNLKFTKIEVGDNHALIKLKAGNYYWKRIRHYASLGLVTFKYEPDAFHFTVKPGVVNYPGTWITDLQFINNWKVFLSIKSYNRASFEWAYFKKHFIAITHNTKFQYQGIVKDEYPTYIEKLKQANKFTDDNAIYYQNKKAENLPINFYNIKDGIKPQTEKFPLLKDYLQDFTSPDADISSLGEYIVMSSMVDETKIFEVIETKNFNSHVILNIANPEAVNIRNLIWIDADSIIFGIMFITNDYIDNYIIIHLEEDYHIYLQKTTKLLLHVLSTFIFTFIYRIFIMVDIWMGKIIKRILS